MNDLRILRGMEKQFRLRAEHLKNGEKHIGWKVGFGAPASLERLQLDAPLVGFLTDRVILPSGAKVSVKGWTKPAVEPEIAVYVGKDLIGKENRQTTRDAIASIGPAIELADVNFPPDDVERILAEDIFNRHVILGRADPSRAGCDLENLVARVHRNENKGEPVTDLQAQTGDIIDIVSHIANLLSSLGERLSAGQVIITGSIIPPLWIEHTEEVRYYLDPIDEISVKIQVS